MIIKTHSLREAKLICEILMHRGVGFHVRTLEIFEKSPTIETGDDMWQVICDLCAEYNLQSIPFIEDPTR